jgi:hypothetical protein
MNKLFLVAAIGVIAAASSISSAATLLSDDFSGTSASSSRWHIPTWVSSNDGTFIGRTQFRCTQNALLPAINQGNAIIAVESYNPTDATGSSFYGTDLITNQTFSSSQEIHITVRAKMNTSTPGIIGGIFLYALKPGSTTLHDEVDFEFLTNKPDGVQTNIYGNEPLGVGHPQFSSYTSGTITDYHTYEIKWTANQVSWLVDGNLVRTDTSHVPTEPMYLHLNMWVPGTEWSEAYSQNLQPTNSANFNQIFSMSVDSVNVEGISSTKTSSLTPVLHLLLTNKR